MCGRYALHANPDVIALQFGLATAPEFKQSYNVCPGTEILTVRVDEHRQRVARHSRWGNKLTNARGESIAERPAFRDAFRQWRCLVPASGFYEWQSVAGQKQPWYLTPTDADLFGLAAITAVWKGVRSVSLITTAPNAVMESIHDRMPVIIARQHYAQWLDPANQDVDGLMSFVRPYPPERMTKRSVSPRVNQPENDDPRLIEEAAPRQSSLL
jgi:putative SOS response-associated peptidase YedK